MIAIMKTFLSILTIVLLVFLQLSWVQTCCPDRSALSSIDAVVYERINGQSEVLTSVNFLLLDQYEIVDVTSGNVTVLCSGMIGSFPKLRKLHLIHLNISTVDATAFQVVLPQLTHLSLSLNHIKQLQNGTFDKLLALQVLYLTANEIDTIESNVFAALPQLEQVHLDRNRITTIQPDWFRFNTHIRIVNLNRNEITRLQSGAFALDTLCASSTASAARIDIRLRSNYIKLVEPGVVQCAARIYLVLQLDHNNITQIDSDLLASLSHYNSNLILNNNLVRCLDEEALKQFVERDRELSVHIVRNPISCMCVGQFDQFLDTYGYLMASTALYYNSTETCDTREPYADLKENTWWRK